MGLLVRQLGLEQARLPGLEERQHLGRRGLPPGQSAQVGLAQREVLAGQVGARQRGARQAAVVRARSGLVAARQAGDDGAGLAVQGGQPRAVAQRLRLGDGDAARGQVVHQFDVERQLFLRQHLEQRQYVLAAGRIQEEVGVFDAGGDAAQ